jgi:hypothetical protein
MTELRYSEGMRVVVIQYPHEHYGNKGTITRISGRRVIVEVDFGGGEWAFDKDPKHLRITGWKKKSRA